MHTSDTARSDWAANSAVSSAARLARSAALLAIYLSLSCSHAVFPQLCGLGTPPVLERRRLALAPTPPVPIMRTSAPWTALAWMQTTSPEGSFPKPTCFVDEPPCRHGDLTTLALSARASRRLDSGSSSSSWRFSLSSRWRPCGSRRTQFALRLSMARRCEPPASILGATGS